MTLKKTLAKSAIAFLFSTFLTFAVLTLSLYQITDKDTIKPIALQIVRQQISDEQLGQLHAYLTQQCQGKDTVDVQVQNEKIAINCSDVRSKTPQALIESIYLDNLDKIYETRYDCEFLDCLKSQPTVVFSSKAHDFFLSMIYLFFVLTVAFAALLAYMVRETGRFGLMKTFGWSLVFVGISYFIILAAKTAIIPAEVAAIAGPALDTIFNIILFNLLVVLIAGIALLAAGYLGPKIKLKKRK